MKFCFKDSINLLNKDIKIFIKFLLQSDNLLFIKSNNSFNPLGNIFIFVSIIIFSIFSTASFFSSHFPSSISFINSLVIFFEISWGFFVSNTILFSKFFSIVSSPPFIFVSFLFFKSFKFIFLSGVSSILSSSASIIFKVDSFISLIAVLIFVPYNLYKIQINCVDAVLTCGLLLLAIYFE